MAKGGQSPAALVLLIRAAIPAFEIKKEVVRGQINFHYKGVAIEGGKLVRNFDSKKQWPDTPSFAEVKNKSLSLDFMVPPQVKAMGVKGIGTKMFDMAFEHFQNAIDTFKAEWLVSSSYPDGLSDNLKLFILNYNGSNTIAAAEATWTAAMAKNNNYYILDTRDVKITSGRGRGMRYDSGNRKFVPATKNEFGIDGVEATFRKKP